jgi:CRISPR-associated protein Csm4
MTRKCYKLTFLSPLHVSSGGFGLESADNFVHSDTLYSALCSAGATLWDQERLSSLFFTGRNGAEKPAFRLSSAFPFWADQLFLPKPFFLRPENEATLRYADLKKWKDVHYLSASLWKTSMENIPLIFNPATAYSNRGCYSGLVFPDEPGFRLWQDGELPRVVLDRVSNASQIFHFAQIEFRENAGLWFMVDFDDDARIPDFESLLTLLGESGLGGDRTVGKGQFIFEPTAVPLLPEVENHTACCTLSLFLPSLADLESIDFHRSWYRFQLRQGWVSDHSLRRRTLRMFNEGSVFRVNTPHRIEGQLVKALDQSEFPKQLRHDVWRNGMAFCIPVVLPLEKNDDAHGNDQ